MRTPEEHRQYCKEYRAEGFGAVSDKRYYRKHYKELRKKALERYYKRKAKEEEAKSYRENS